MRNILKISCALLVTAPLLTGGCAAQRNKKALSPFGDQNVRIVAEMLLEQNQEPDRGKLSIITPADGAVFPPEIASPIFRWQDATPGASHWLIAIEMTDGRALHHVADEPQWSPIEEDWELIKKGSVSAPAIFTVIGFQYFDVPELLSADSIRVSTSVDRVDDLILYRQVPLPFMVGKRNFKKIKWRLGDVAAYGKPPVVMQNMPVCASCHQVSSDGNRLSMELNYQDDAGAQFVAEIQEDIALSASDFMTWSDYPKLDIIPKTRGLFARLSPSGNHLVGTVNEISYMALTNEPAFSQLFFPTYGILATYSIEKKTFRSLPGADDVAFVQTNPAWSPDERYIAFARSATKNEYHEDIARIKTHIEDCGIDDLNRRFPMQYDIWQVPFHQGDGGTAQPLEGASNNGMSNYFPRYSPDGKWIVFTRSSTGIMLQPDSELYIVASGGGEARRMRCNRQRFNSWHSWSANSRWLLFSSKVNSIYTEIFITHVDENGYDSPPICLTRMSDDRLAANLPEFVGRNTGRIQSIRLSR